MFRPTTILLLSALLCTFHDAPRTCFALPALSSTDDPAGTTKAPSPISAVSAVTEASSATTDLARNATHPIGDVAGVVSKLGKVFPILQRFTRDTERNLTSLVDDLAAELMGMPISVLRDISGQLGHALNQLRSSVRGIASSLESTANSLLNELDLKSDIAGDAKQLALDVSDALPLGPLDGSRRALRSAQNSSDGDIETAVADGIRNAVNYLSTQGLPWLHDTLDQYENSFIVPMGLRMLVKSLDHAYDVLQELGYVKPGNS